MRRPSVLVLSALTLGLAACGSGSDTTSTPSAPAATASTPTAAPSTSTAAPATSSTVAVKPSLKDCVKNSEPGGGKAIPCPTETLVVGKTNVLTFKTSQGSFDVTLAGAAAPETANSVAYLAKRGFYDGLDFHRVVPDFVIQGGDPNGDGTGGPGYTVTEAPPSTQTYTSGVVAMAKGGTEASGASGSQFFVVTGADVGLPPEYALVGTVTKGLGTTIKKISALGVADGTPPKKKITIEKVTLSTK